MPGYIPKKPVGSSFFYRWAIRVHEMLFEGRFPFIDTPTVRWDKKSNGYAAHANMPRSAVAIPAAMFPFKIYTPDPLPVDGRTVVSFDTNGTPFNLTVDSTVPTNIVSGGTVNPTTDAWRFIAVRNGVVEFRPYYWVPSRYYYAGNYAMYIGGDLDFANNDYIYPENTGLPYDAPIVNPYTYISAILVIPGDPDAWLVQDMGFALWIEITPDTSSNSTPSTTIKGARFSFGSYGAYSLQPFPTSSQLIIPIGHVQSGLGTSFPQLVFKQILWGHAINRYPAFTGANGVFNFRGWWDANDDDIQNKVMYPGDVVLKTVGAQVQLLMITAVHKNNGNSDIPAYGGYWKLLSQF